MLIILTLAFTQGHAHLYNENNKCLIISETASAIPIMFHVKVVRLKVYMTIARPVALVFIQGHACVSNVTIWKRVIYRTTFKLLHSQTWHDGRLMYAWHILNYTNAMLVSMILTMTLTLKLFERLVLLVVFSVADSFGRQAGCDREDKCPFFILLLRLTCLACYIEVVSLEEGWGN